MGAGPSGEVLGRRALNRATLERQMLLRRWALPVEEAVERLVGLQAQTTHTWYVGLWARLDGFDPHCVGDLLNQRRVVRVALMRSTIHLVTARDCLALRPLLQPVLARSVNANFRRRLEGVDPETLSAAGRALVDAQPLTFTEIGKRLAEQWPGRDAAALAQAVRAWVPLVQVPPRGIWGASGQARHTSVESWLGRPLDPNPDLERLVIRYLGAFGPASVRDMQTWSGLTRLGDVVERLRPGLLAFRDESGRELFDLPDAPRPDPDTPVPPRFLYDFDNLLLSHADRRRVVADEHRKRLMTNNGQLPGTVLVDGFVRGTWRIKRGRGTATLLIDPFEPLARQERAALSEEGARLLAFAAADAGTHDIRFTAPA